jgi:hypothetical protein
MSWFYNTAEDKSLPRQVPRSGYLGGYKVAPIPVAEAPRVEVLKEIAHSAPSLPAFVPVDAGITPEQNRADVGRILDNAKTFQQGLAASVKSLPIGRGRSNADMIALVEAQRTDTLPQYSVTNPPQAPAAASVPPVVAPTAAPAKTAPKVRPLGTARAGYNNTVNGQEFTTGEVKAYQEMINQGRDPKQRIKVDGKWGQETAGAYADYVGNIEKGLALQAAQQAQAPVAQQAPVQQPSFLGMKLDQQATEAAWDKWRSNDAPEGYIPTAVYR